MKTGKILAVATVIITSLFLTVSCGKDDNTLNREPDFPDTSNLTYPKLDKYLTTTDYDGVSFRVRFTNGGDVMENMSCTVHWRRYSSKPSKTPKAGDMTEHESMRYYGAGTKLKTTFDRSHAGITGGSYLYYYFECSNSAYTTETDITYCVVKR